MLNSCVRKHGLRNRGTYQLALNLCALRRSEVWTATNATAAVLVAAVAALAGDRSQLEISTNFLSGSGEIESVDQASRVIRITPTVYPDRGWPCWWYFKVSGITPGDTITIDLAGDKWAQPAQATFSIDQQTWQHTRPGKRREGRIVYRQQVDASEAWFAWGPPFTDVDAANLVKRAAETSPCADVWTLCHSREGRVVPALRVEQPGVDGPDRYGVWVGARQHAWECGSSWVARGFIEWLISDEPRAEALRNEASIVIVPVMDVDNVALGAGGKNQKPQDHNRDWTDEPFHPAVAAAQREIKRLDDAGRFHLYVDLHNPAPADRDPFFFVPPRAEFSDGRWEHLQRFLIAARAELSQPLAFRGRAIETDAGYDQLWNQKSSVWVTRNTARHVVAVTLETPWNTPFSTTEGYQTVGRGVGLAIDRYLRVLPK